MWPVQRNGKGPSGPVWTGPPAAVRLGETSCPVCTALECPWGRPMDLNVRTARSWLPPVFPAGFVPWNLHNPVRCWW